MDFKNSGLKDINGREIYSGMVCEDTINFSPVFIKEINGRFYASSHILKLEPLESVVEELRIIK